MTLEESPSIEHWTVRLARKDDCHVQVEVHMTREQAACLVAAETKRAAQGRPESILDPGKAVIAALLSAMR